MSKTRATEMKRRLPRPGVGEGKRFSHRLLEKSDARSLRSINVNSECAQLKVLHWTRQLNAANEDKTT